MRLRVTENGGDNVWFRALTDSATDVYFRYRLAASSDAASSAGGGAIDDASGETKDDGRRRGAGRFEYLSPSVQALTGMAPDAFYADASLCVRLFSRADRRALRQALRARKPLTLTLDGIRSTAPDRHDSKSSGDVAAVALAHARRALQVRTTPVVKRHHLVAIEGLVSIVAAPAASADVNAAPAPVQQRLSALLYEVHSLLHLNPPPGGSVAASTIRLGDLLFDVERLSVTEQGKTVALTSRELMVLRYLLTRPGRLVTREQLLADVWGYRYTGDARTVDVHMSRLRRKLPSLQRRLVAVKHLGYRLEEERLVVNG